MEIYIHNNHMQVVDVIDNDVPGSLKIKSDTFTRYFVEATSTYDFEIDKYVNNKLHPKLESIKPNMFVSFRYHDKDWLFLVTKMVENGRTIKVQCDNLNLVLLTMECPEYEAETEYSLVDYISKFDLLSKTRLELGINEADPGRKVSLKLNKETYLSRLRTLAIEFDCEIEFITKLEQDGSLEKFIVNFYRERSDDNPNDGVGNNRKDVTLEIDREINDVTVTTDRTTQYTAMRLKLKDGSYFKAKKNHIVKAKDQKLNEYFIMRNNQYMYAPLAMVDYPAVTNQNDCDNWVYAELTTELTDYDAQYNYLLSMLKKYAYPNVTYEIKLNSSYVLDSKNLDVGDTVYGVDDQFIDGLLFSARISRIEVGVMSYKDPVIEVTNAVRLKSNLNKTFVDRVNALIEQSQPYQIELVSPTGLFIDSSEDLGVVEPRLKKGDKYVTEPVVWKYYDGVELVASTPRFERRLSDMGDLTYKSYTVSAEVNEKEVASTTVTFTKLPDGITIVKTEMFYKTSSRGSSEPQKLPDDKDTNHTGWSVDVLEPTTSEPYLWRYEKFTYSNDQVEYRDPYILSVKGDTGPSNYTWIMYADSSLGINMSKSPEGKRYMGVAENRSVPTPSNNPSDYKWSPLYDNVKVGGVNLLNGSSDLKINENGNSMTSEFYVHPAFESDAPTSQIETQLPITGINAYIKLSAQENERVFFQNGVKLEKGTYTFSVWVKCSSGTKLSLSCFVDEKEEYAAQSIQDEGWHLYTVTQTTNGGVYKAGCVKFSNCEWLQLCAPYLQAGNIASDWAMSQLDIKNMMDGKSDITYTKSELERIDEEQRLMKLDLEARATLELVEIWVQEYRDFVDKTNEERENSVQRLIDATNRLVSVEHNLAESAERWTTLNNFIQFSDEGVVIGENGGDNYFKATDDRISLFDGGQEVMFVSQGLLSIANGIIAESFQIGNFRTEKYSDTMNIIRYVGGLYNGPTG